MKTKIEKETVELAISELKAHNKPVNMQSVMDLTGYTRHHLIAQGYDYLVRKPKHSTNAGPVTIVHPGPVVEPIDLEHTVEAYTAHIRDNYFIHAETIKDVECSMHLEVVGFQTEIYRKAINLLMLSKELQPHTVKPDLYIGNFAVDALTAAPALVEPTPPAAEPQEQPKPQPDANAVYLVVSGNIVMYNGSSLEKATEKAAELSHDSYNKSPVLVFKSFKSVRTEIVIIEEQQ